MSKHHQHVAPFSARPPRANGALRPDSFGALVGTIDHVTLNAHDGPKPDDNHVYPWIYVNSGPYSGRYECAFNTQSNREQGSDAEVLYLLHEESISTGDFPSPGFSEAELSYSGLGLQTAAFQPIINGTLRSLVMQYAQTADLVTAYGVTYKEGNGLHDIHRNDDRNGNQDGAMVFYFRPQVTQAVRRWIFIKFKNQEI